MLVGVIHPAAVIHRVVPTRRRGPTLLLEPIRPLVHEPLRMHSGPSALYRAIQGVAQPRPYLPLPHHLAVRLTRNLRAIHTTLLQLAVWMRTTFPRAHLPRRPMRLCPLSHLIWVTPQRKLVYGLQLSRHMFYRVRHGNRLLDGIRHCGCMFLRTVGAVGGVPDCGALQKRNGGGTGG